MVLRPEDHPKSSAYRSLSLGITINGLENVLSLRLMDVIRDCRFPTGRNVRSHARSKVPGREPFSVGIRRSLIDAFPIAMIEDNWLVPDITQNCS